MGIKILELASKLHNDPAMIELRNFSSARRKELAKSGSALPDGSFPIENCEDHKNARILLGKAKNKAKAAAHIAKRGAALGCGAKR